MSGVSRETSERLSKLADLVRAWTPKINLISKSSVGDLETRHIIDSLQVAEAANNVRAWCDLGSGGGFPGLVVAIVHPEIRVTLIESDQRKCVFLRHASRELGLSVTIRNARIENAEPTGADIVSARALAPLSQLIPLAVRHGSSDARFIFPKGASFRQELDAIRCDWSFEIDVRPSKTEKEAVILVLGNVERA